MENNILKHRMAVVNNIAKSFGYESSSDLLEKSEENEIEKAKHQDGDMHPNGKWVWRQSANGGNGDWRVAKPGGSKTTTVRTDASKTQMDKEAKSSSTSGVNKKRFFNIHPDGTPIDLSKIDDKRLKFTINLVKTNIEDIKMKINALNGKKPKTFDALNEQFEDQRGKLSELEEEMKKRK